MIISFYVGSSILDRSALKKRKNKKNKSKNKKNKKNKNNNNNNESNELLQEKGGSIGPSLTFLNAESQRQNVIQTNFDLRSGRQVNTDKVVVPGFPNGLPNGVPEGVKIALASAQRGILQ